MTETLSLQLTQWAETALAPFTPAKHHEILLEHLVGVDDGSIDRLMVLMPPGSAKSTYASLIFPAFWFRQHPNTAIIAASHTAEFASHFGRGLRHVIGDHKPTLGYHVASDNRAAHRFATTNGGSYFATGVRGPITGRRADLILIDDPVKGHVEADSSNSRDSLHAWYRTDLVTRLKPRGRIVLIMTRWHEDDLGGRLAETGEWTILRLPAIAEKGDPFRQPGEALWPDYEDLAALERKRETVGARVWSALYQQAPRPDTGSQFPVAAIGIRETQPVGLPSVRAWDLAATAASDGRDPDWTVGLLLAREPDGRSIVQDVTRIRGGPSEVAEALTSTARQDGVGVTISMPQDPGQAGKMQVDWFKALLSGFQVVSSPETGAKSQRSGPVSVSVGRGMVSLVRGAWNRVFLDELRDFPQGRKDDQVDAFSRAFNHFISTPPPARRANVPLFAR